MATYFSTNLPGIQAVDNMQTLYLMNPGLVGFPDAPSQGNILMFGQHAGSQLPGNEQQFISIPMMAQPPAMAASHPGDLGAGVAAGSNLRQYGLWRNNIPSEFSFVQSINQTSPATTNASSSGNQHRIPGVPTDSSHQSVVEVPSQAGLRREQQGGLSLSLSSSPVQLMASTNSFRSETPAPAVVVPPSAGGCGGEATGEERVARWEGGLQSVLMGSKYLRAAQQLLDEVVNVGRELRSGREHSRSTEKEGKAKKEPTAEEMGDVGSNQGSELSAAERQELQMKKAKLITMLEEVDQRYKQYRHQMQVVVSSFEAAAGAGAARAYTALALQTISKQFRCLRDAISGQIRLTNRSLGEEEGVGGSKADGSRLRYIDHQLRQQRALQQLGMVQNNAWRPQRGLPERSVSVLRAWLFEHFLHPYPKDADKVMLAKQTGLTRSQVSNWFINARVRLWKPMVEEMYMEEIKEHENEGKSEEKSSQSAEANDDSVVMKPATTDSPVSASRGVNKNANSQNEEITTEKRASPASLHAATAAMRSLGNLKNLTGLGLIVSPSSSDHHAPSILDNESPSHFTPKKIRNNGFHDSCPLPSVNAGTNIAAEAPNAAGFGGRQGYDLAAAVAAAAAAATENGRSYGSYQIGDIGRYSHESFAPRGNGVSLTLGLPHCDSLSLSGSQHACLSSPNMAMGRRHELGSEASNGFCSQNPSAAAAPAGLPGNAYETITMQSRKRFAAQLLPDFVS